MDLLEDIKREAVRVLEEGKVKYLIGYRRGGTGLSAVPAFIYEPAEVEQLIWNGACVHNLVRFLVDERRNRAQQEKPDTRPVAIIAKGCDSRAINVLLQEKLIERDDVYVIGVSCGKSGVMDGGKVARRFKGKRPEAVKFDGPGHFLVVSKSGNIKVPVEEIMAARCLECGTGYPVVYDVVIGENVKREIAEPFGLLEPVEGMSREEKREYWENRMSKCIRCYACRSVCPMCYCDECVVDSIDFMVTPQTTAQEKAEKIKWINKSPQVSENRFFHSIRAVHLAGRCIDCGECGRVCPVNIPLRHLNKKMEKEAKEKFDYEAGFDSESPSLISSFRDEDPQDFIR